MKVKKINYDNYRTIENSFVIGNDNDNVVKIGKKIDSLYLLSDDNQSSCELFDFDNETSFLFDKKGRFYVAEISMKDEIDFYLDAVENYDNSVVWGEDIYEQLIEKYPEKSDRINEINNNF